MVIITNNSNNSHQQLPIIRHQTDNSNNLLIIQTIKNNNYKQYNPKLTIQTINQYIHQPTIKSNMKWAQPYQNALWKLNYTISDFAPIQIRLFFWISFSICWQFHCCSLFTIPSTNIVGHTFWTSSYFVRHCSGAGCSSGACATRCFGLYRQGRKFGPWPIGTKVHGPWKILKIIYNHNCCCYFCCVHRFTYSLYHMVRSNMYSFIIL